MRPTNGFIVVRLGHEAKSCCFTANCYYSAFLVDFKSVVIVLNWVRCDDVKSFLRLFNSLL